MIARARVTVEAGPGHSLRYSSLRSAAPLLLRPTPAALYLVGGAAGPCGGDHVTLQLALGPDARLTVRSMAATLARPGRIVGQRSLLEVSVELSPGSSLAWLPEPGVVGAGCAHSVVVRVRMGLGCCLAWRDELVLGRHGEAPGSWRASLHVDLAGQPLARQGLEIGPCAHGWEGAAVAGGVRAIGSMLVVHPDLSAPGAVSGYSQHTEQARVAVMALAGPALLVSALAPTAIGLRRTLDRQADRLSCYLP